jgi:hypothetical protein
MILRLRSAKIVRGLRRDSPTRGAREGGPAAEVACGTRVKEKIFHFQIDNVGAAS